MARTDIMFVGINEIVLLPDATVEQFERVMNEEVLSRNFFYATRAGWVTNQQLLRGFGDDRTYLLMFHWIQPYSTPTPENLRERMDKIYESVQGHLDALGKRTALHVYSVTVPLLPDTD